MAEVTYSKKQLNPLISKYAIDVENNAVFHNIIAMFNDQPNYQIWAIKCVFGGVCPLDTIVRIKDWVENNQTEIKNLTKGNIILYKTPSDINALFDEIEGLEMISFVRNSVNRFNTTQREMLKKKIFSTPMDGITAKRSSNMKRMFTLFKNVETLPKHRKEHLINTSSAITDIDFLIEHINNALSASYDWEKEDMLSFMSRNASDCTVVYDCDHIVVLQVPSFESSKALCGNSRTGWCLTREKSYFNRYVIEPRDAKQYFLFDFSKREDDDLAHIGFTVRTNGGITNAHSTKNNNLLGSGVTYRGKNVNIYQALRMCNIPNKVFMPIGKLSEWKWELESILKLIENNGDALSMCFAENNRLIVHPLSQRGIQLLINHTLIPKNEYTIRNDRKLYILLDFNLEYNDDNALVLMEYVKDKYGCESLYGIRNVFNVSLKDTNFLDSVGIETSSFLNRETISPKILLHKLIDERNENEAIALIAKEGDEFDVNYEFSMTLPVFKAIQMRQFNLFKAIVNHKNFNSATSDEYGESVLMSLMFTYTCDSSSSEDKQNIKKLITAILDSKTFNFNVQDINLDTALHIASMRKDLNWVMARILERDDVNINLTNDEDCTPLGTAITMKNTDAIRLLAQRSDLLVRDVDFELAKEYGVALDSLLKSEKGWSASASKFDTHATTPSLSEIFEQALASRK